MTLSFEITKELVDLILRQPENLARRVLHDRLLIMDSTEGQFYTSLVKHSGGLKLTTEQWFDLLSKLPNRFLRSELDLPGLLSEEQLKRLPPVTG